MIEQDVVASWVCGLMKTDYPALGFIQSTTVEERYIAKGRYILQLDERGRRVGYLLHGSIRYGQRLVISQAMIDYDYRLRGYGEAAVRELVRRAGIGRATSIRVRCATDLDAVDFWQASGFRLVGIVPGGEARNRMIAKFVYPLALPLFDRLEQVESEVAK